jgi:hypothetical protein
MFLVKVVAVLNLFCNLYCQLFRMEMHAGNRQAGIMNDIQSGSCQRFRPLFGSVAALQRAGLVFKLVQVNYLVSIGLEAISKYKKVVE